MNWPYYLGVFLPGVDGEYLLRNQFYRVISMVKPTSHTDQLGEWIGEV